MDIDTVARLASASRGEDAYVGDAPSTWYYIHDGVYAQSGTLMFMTKGGVPGGAHRYFVGQSRAGVVIHGRAAIDDAVGDITLQNLTFDLTGYSESKSFNTLTILIERNRITENGHADYEDGIVINGSGTGAITNVTIQRNILDHNYQSGVRFAGGVESGIVITRNTFAANGAGSSSPSRSEINLDAMGGAAGTAISANLFDVGNALINDCHDAATFNSASATTSSTAWCRAVRRPIAWRSKPRAIPSSSIPPKGDFHPGNPAAAAYGAYST